MKEEICGREGCGHRKGYHYRGAGTCMMEGCKCVSFTPWTTSKQLAKAFIQRIAPTDEPMKNQPKESIYAFGKEMFLIKEIKATPTNDGINAAQNFLNSYPRGEAACLHEGGNHQCYAVRAKGHRDMFDNPAPKGRTEAERIRSMAMGREPLHIQRPEELKKDECYICGHAKKFHKGRYCTATGKDIWQGQEVTYECGVGAHDFISWEQARKNPGSNEMKIRWLKSDIARLEAERAKMNELSYFWVKTKQDEKQASRRAGKVTEEIKKLQEELRLLEPQLGNPSRDTSTTGLTIVGACCILIETTRGRVSGKMGRVLGLPDGSVLIEGNFPKVPQGTVKLIEYMDDAKAEAEGEQEKGIPWRHEMESERIALERTQGGLLMRRKNKPLWEMR